MLNFQNIKNEKFKNECERNNLEINIVLNLLMLLVRFFVLVKLKKL